MEHVFEEFGIDEPSALTRIGVLGFVAFAEAATGEWVDQPSVSRSEFVALVVATLSNTLAELVKEGA